MKWITWLLLIGVSWAASPTPSDDPASVLIVVNDLTPAEEGTGELGASEYVAEVYRAARGIPAGNVVHISQPLACCDNDPHHFDSTHISYANFVQYIRTPIQEYMAANGLTNSIRYIVPTYGVATHISDKYDGASVDAFLAQMSRADPQNGLRQNPYYASNPTTLPGRFKDVTLSYRMYLVSRLDGPSALYAAGLATKAIEAERLGVRALAASGTGYFDRRGISSVPEKLVEDSIVNSKNYCDSAGFTCTLNNQAVSGQMITDGSNALWVWGWYTANTTNDVYTFAPGAVGTQHTSYTANNLRAVTGGNWCSLFITRGITATWGATAEPFVGYYALADGVFYRLWKGYNFAEAGWSSSPYTGWMMVFVGDPLYRPVIVAARAKPRGTVRLHGGARFR